MSKTLLIAGLLIVAVLSSPSSTSNRSPEFDHTTVHVRDLQKSAEFYEKVIGLEKIPEPFKDGRHVWFRMGAHNQLHVVGGAKDIVEHDIDVHLAFRVSSVTEFVRHLDQMQVKYFNSKGEPGILQVRPDGVKQIYLQDPDGYWIEVNDDKF